MKSGAFARHTVISMPVSITEPACVYLSGSGQPMEEPVRRRPSCAAPLSSWESRGGDVRLAVYADCRAVTDSMPRGFPRASCLTYTLYVYTLLSLEKIAIPIRSFTSSLSARNSIARLSTLSVSVNKRVD